jgi:23S rRNA (cytosine1962-C5)-methyltransferase
MIKVILRNGREHSVLRRHPWIFSGAIQRTESTPEPGETVEVCAADGAPLARGACSPASQIAVRVWTFDPCEEINAAFFRRRLERAIRARAALLAREDLSACRLVYGEADGLPGLIVDRYARWLVCQFLSTGPERWKREIVDELAQLMPGYGVWERSDADAREKEGLTAVAGPLVGPAPAAPVEINEGQFRFLVDVVHGQKTGFYLDQRENRLRVAERSRGAAVLNCFAYTGGFTVAALAGAACSVTQIESSGAALEMARRNVALNGFECAAVEDVEGDVFAVLRGFRDRGRRFDLVILDPPKFVDTKGHLMGAARGYKDINLLAVKLLRPGGLLFTFSCSGLLGRELFQKIVADAALDAGRAVQVIGQLSQASDHPVLLSFPESGYLKGFVCRAE